jgi:hypothetical protein
MANEFTDTNVTGSLGMTGEIVIDENSAALSSAAAGKGIIYVKDTTPCTLRFIDDAGTDITIGEAGAGGINQLTGDVTAGPGTGSQAATIAAGAVEMSMIDASGTADGTTFLRGDGAWATPAGSGDMTLAGTQTVTGAKTFEDGTLVLEGATSGTTTVKAAAAAGTTTATGAFWLGTNGYFQVTAAGALNFVSHGDVTNAIIADINAAE